MVLAGSIPNVLVLVAILLMTTVVFAPTTLGLLLVTVSSLSALVVPCITTPNWSAGVTESAASVPVPFSAVAGTLLVKLLVTGRLPVRVPCAVGVKLTPAVQLSPTEL